MSKLIDQGLAALAELGTRHEQESGAKAAKELADVLARRKAMTIRTRAKIIESDWMNLSLRSKDPDDAAKLKRLVNMSAEEAAADDGLAVQMLDAAEAIIKAKRESLKPNVPGPSNGGEEGAPEPLSAPQPFVWRDPRTIPLMPWIYGTHLLRGCVSLTVAASGAGKTFLKIGETVSMVRPR